MKGGNVTLNEQEDILEMFKNGTSIAEIALIMDRGMEAIINTLVKLKQIKETEYQGMVYMPMEWVAEWLEIHKKYGKHGK